MEEDAGEHESPNGIPSRVEVFTTRLALGKLTVAAGGGARGRSDRLGAVPASPPQHRQPVRPGGGGRGARPPGEPAKRLEAGATAARAGVRVPVPGVKIKNS